MSNQHKTLKICLAMGGGVSLGSFSGSSLTEALKLLLLFGQDKDGKKYDRIIVDGMSGASAGALALTIMLKTLLDYKAMMKKLDPALTKEVLIDELKKEYGTAVINELNAEKKEALIALQVAQKVQQVIWVDTLKIENLYGRRITKNYRHNPNDSFALLERSFLTNIAKKYILPEDFNIANKQILADDRFILACSLTNMLPIATLKNSKYNDEDVPDEIIEKRRLEQNVIRSTGSFNHTELRVIDFVFQKELKNETDSRWLRFTNNPDSKRTLDVDINKKKSWALLTSSALACGAFPVAFEPVILKRYKEEFGYNWPEEFSAISEKLKSNGIRQKSFFNEAGEGKELNYEYFNFPYIDGGTFNNEPIKEAFKIGSFQDFGNHKQDFDRLILFVDPIVRQDDNHPFLVKSFAPINSNKKNQPKFNGELGKLLSNVFGLVGLLRNQGNIKEEHKVTDIKENFELQDQLYEYYSNSENLYAALTLNLLIKAFDKIMNNLREGTLSIGTRDPFVYFADQRKKVFQDSSMKMFRTEPKYNASKVIEGESIERLYHHINLNQIQDINDVYEFLGLHSDTEKNLFAETVLKTITEFSLNTQGKNPKANRVAIMPIDSNLETTSLPGSEIEAFSGFASYKARLYAYEYGKYCTFKTLKTKAFRKDQDAPFLKLPSQHTIEKNIESKLDNIKFFKYELYTNRLKLLFKLSIKRIIGLFNLNVSSYLALIFGGFIIAGLTIIALLKKLVSVFLTRKTKSMLTTIREPYLQSITISILSTKKLPKVLSVTLKNGSKKKLKLAKQSVTVYNNDEKPEKGYQYLFQLNVLDYRLKNEIALAFDKRIKLPDDIDKNLRPLELRKEIEKQYDSLVIDTIYAGNKIREILKDINEPESSLYYSIRNLKYHVSPMLELNLAKTNDSWYFKENTSALYKTMC